MKLVELKLVLIFVFTFAVSFALIASASFIHSNTIIASVLIILLMYLGANSVLMSIGTTIDKRWRLYFPGAVCLGLGLGLAIIVGETLVGIIIGILAFLILLYYGDYTRILYENQVKIYIKPLIERQVFALSFIYAVSCAVIVFINAPDIEKEIITKITNQVDVVIKSEYIQPYLKSSNQLALTPESTALSNMISGSLVTYSKHLIAVLSFAAFWAFEIAARIVWYFFLITLRPAFYLLKKSRFINVEQKNVLKEMLTI